MAKAPILNILQKLRKTIVVAHSRPPNHTGDHGHLKKRRLGRDSNVSLRVTTQQEGTNAKTREMQQNQLHFPLEQQTRCSTPSRPNPQQTNYSKRGVHNSQTETVEHPEQPSNTHLNPVPEPKSERVYLG
ncbi:hypothetical protein E2C01_086710 [Portunus trituberculatus]|uniref:Uncharacterized protein n=1 Tax=Portunus trituberculatus TaxID=210409 RepID=A0A5B7JFD3_PORTR|nr:hypothetical protein [Portunus trituberculatus]